MDARQKEQYLREYQVLKEQGKPFFPYAVLKDSVMSAIVMVVIIALAVILGAGELQNKADPTTVTYTPRPDWYFYFLFEVLRVIKPPSLVVLATIGVPTIAMVLLVLLPFIDRNPERHPAKRPIATTFGISMIVLMAYLTYLGAHARAPDQIDMKPPSELNVGESRQFFRGQQVANQAGCGACHKFDEAGGTLGPDLSEAGDKLPPDAIARTLQIPVPPMPAYTSLPRNKFNDLVYYVSNLK
ncbi:MAG: c-type cytochrome [Solirubrobacterales bacterium]